MKCRFEFSHSHQSAMRIVENLNVSSNVREINWMDLISWMWNKLSDNIWPAESN